MISSGLDRGAGGEKGHKLMPSFLQDPYVARVCLAVVTSGALVVGVEVGLSEDLKTKSIFSASCPSSGSEPILVQSSDRTEMSPCCA